VKQWKAYRAMLRRGDADRVRRLVADGDTIEVRDLVPTDTVIHVTLGFGDEFWRVGESYSANPVEGRVDGGRLILERGERLTDRSRLSFLENEIKEVVYAS
jgi:hypothetical protein